MGKPTLVVVSGPAGTGKTTLAHELARVIGCPAVCRDELKEGMVAAAEPTDEAEAIRSHQGFQRVSLRVPTLEVDTTEGYRPPLPDIAAFAVATAAELDAG